MRFIYFVRNQFSRYCSREILLILQIVLMICLMSPVLTDVSTLLHVDRLASTLSRPAMFFQAESRYLTPDGMAEEQYSEMLDSIDGIVGQQNTGRIANAVGRSGTTSIMLRFYNPALVSNIGFSLSAGSMPKMTEGDKVLLVINEKLAEKYHVGDVLSSVSIYFPISKEYREMDMVVAGIMDSNGYYFAFMGGGSTVDLNALGARISDSEHQAVVIGGFDAVPIRDIAASCLMFCEDDKAEVCAQLNETVTGRGVIIQISEMRRSSLQGVVSSQPMVFLAAVLMLLLCAIGIITYTWMTVEGFVGRYSMYYICGMTRWKGIVTLMVVQLIPALISIPISIWVTHYIQAEISAEGIQLAVGLVVPMLLLCSMLMSLRFRMADPILLMRKSE